MSNFAFRVAVVTGGAGGIGQAVARRLAAQGVAVGILDRDAERATKLAQDLRPEGFQAASVSVDVRKFRSVQDALTRVRECLGPVEIRVNNAGWDRIQRFVDNAPELWDELIAINLKGAIYATRAVVDDMLAARRGRLIFVSSDAARVGSSGEAVYAACKAGLIGFAKSLARELASSGITSNVVCPGPTQTPLLEEITRGEAGAKVISAMTRSIPIGRLGSPEDVPSAVAFFASPESGFITGQVLSVSGGLTMVG